MSEMEFFHGYFEESALQIKPADDDDFSELEEEHGCYFVAVDGVLYEFYPSNIDVDPYGFATTLPPTDKNQVIAYWYNGGAGVHEMVEEAIRAHIKRD